MSAPPSIESLVRGRLLQQQSVVTKVGDRIRPDVLSEDDALPAIVIDSDEETHENDLSGLGGLVWYSVNVVCMADTKAEARELAHRVRTNDTNPGTGLAGWSGDVGLQGTIDSAVLNSATTEYWQLAEGNDTGWYVVTQNYTIAVQETT